MIPPVKSILINQEQVKAKVLELGKTIQADFEDEPLVVLSVLNGGFMFHADLIRAMNLDIEIGFLSLSSYKGQITPQSNVIESNLPLPELKNRNVLLVEDIYDTGASMAYAYHRCKRENPKSLKTCVFLVKEDVKRVEETPIDYSGFTIPNVFVVGYGLDYNQRYRQLPYVAIPKLENE